MTPLEVLDALTPEELFARLPANRVGETDRRYVAEVLDAGFSNKGEAAGMLGRLEEAFAKRFGASFAITHNSGTGTMQSCLLAAGVGPGDEVIVPASTMASTAFVVVQCGAVVVFADSDPRRFTIDPADIERRITEHTKAVIPVSVFGLAPDYDPIMDLAEKHGLAVVEDNAECFLGDYKGKLVGTIGHAASFSFQASKHMTSGGDGGLVITDDEDYARGIRKAAVVGYAAVDAKPGSTMVPRDVRQDWSYCRHDAMGYNFRMSAPQAALALAQLERLEHLVAARMYIARQYAAVIRDENCDWLIPPYCPEDCVHSYWTYACLLDEEKVGVDWRTFRRAYIANGGDGLYGLWTPLHLEPVFQQLNFYGSPDRAPNFDPRYKGAVKAYREGDCPNVEDYRKRLCLFKTGMQTLDKAHRELDALSKTIQQYS